MFVYNLMVCVVAVLLTDNTSTASVILRGNPQRRVNCLVDPCQVSRCHAHPEATCVADFAGGCNAKFFVGRTALSIGECGSVRPRGRILNDDTENEGSTRTRPSAPTNPSRVRSRSSVPRSSGSSTSGSRIDSRAQAILDAKRRAEIERARAIWENEARIRQEQNSRSGRRRSTSRSRGSSGMRSRNGGRRNSRSRSSSQRRRPSGGFLSRFLRG